LGRIQEFVLVNWWCFFNAVSRWESVFRTGSSGVTGAVGDSVIIISISNSDPCSWVRDNLRTLSIRIFLLLQVLIAESELLSVASLPPLLTVVSQAAARAASSLHTLIILLFCLVIIIVIVVVILHLKYNLVIVMKTISILN
jgi:hypothetical protein